MQIKLFKLDTREDSFEKRFEKYRKNFLMILSNAYPVYYGDEYQLNRIIEGRSTIYLATVDNLLVGASYIKENLRRGGTAVYPEMYRRLGIAGRLIRESFKEFPKQYSILRVDNIKMLSLMNKLGFKKAQSIPEIEKIVQDEFHQLSDFEFAGEYLIFKRNSIKRRTERQLITLLHTFK